MFVLVQGGVFSGPLGRSVATSEEGWKSRGRGKRAPVKVKDNLRLMSINVRRIVGLHRTVAIAGDPR